MPCGSHPISQDFQIFKLITDYREKSFFEPRVSGCGANWLDFEGSYLAARRCHIEAKQKRTRIMAVIFTGWSRTSKIEPVYENEK